MNGVYVFHEDSGHGWLAVNRKELIELNILDKVSSYSYQNKDMVYLEEDCDAPLFVESMKKMKKPFEFYRSYEENTPIRNYKPFSV
jgi:hypothetical protein